MPVKVREIVKELKLQVAAGEKGLDRDAAGGYCGDLLSDVMANTNSRDLWLTIQSHQNIVAVAVLKDLAAIILVNDRQPDEDTAAKAGEEGIPILCTPLSAFSLAGRLHEMGINRSET
jgi:predicted transcriptional regulator